MNAIDELSGNVKLHEKISPSVKACSIAKRIQKEIPTDFTQLERSTAHGRQCVDARFTLIACRSQNDTAVRPDLAALNERSDNERMGLLEAKVTYVIDRGSMKIHRSDHGQRWQQRPFQLLQVEQPDAFVDEGMP